MLLSSPQDWLLEPSASVISAASLFQVGYSVQIKHTVKGRPWIFSLYFYLHSLLLKNNRHIYPLNSVNETRFNKVIGLLAGPHGWPSAVPPRSSRPSPRRAQPPRPTWSVPCGRRNFRAPARRPRPISGECWRRERTRVPSGDSTYSSWKWQFIADLSMTNGDFWSLSWVVYDFWRNILTGKFSCKISIQTQCGLFIYVPSYIHGYKRGVATYSTSKGKVSRCNKWSWNWNTQS